MSTRYWLKKYIFISLKIEKNMSVYTKHYAKKTRNFKVVLKTLKASCYRPLDLKDRRKIGV